MRTLSDLDFKFETDGKYNEDYVYESLYNFIFKNQNLNKMDFLKNLTEVIANELKLKNIAVGIDKSLLKENDKAYKASAYAHYTIKTVFLNENVFTDKFQIFQDILILAHELKHFDVERSNDDFKKFINKNNSKYYFSARNDFFTNTLNITDKKILSINYFSNENENLANEFAYSFIEKFMDKFQLKLSSYEVEFFKFLKSNITTTISSRREKYMNSCDRKNEVELILSEQRENFIEEIINIMPKDAQERVGAEKIQIQVRNFTNFLTTFQNYYNEEEFNLYKNAFYKNSLKSHPMYIYFYNQMLNFENYVVKKEDLIKLNNFYTQNNIPFNFKDLKLDRKSLIKFYLTDILKIDTKTINAFINSTNLLSIDFSSDLKDKLEFFNKKQEIIKEK